MSRKFKPRGTTEEKEILNNDILFTKSDKNLKGKHRNLIKGLLNLKEITNLRVHITDNAISIGCDKYIDPPMKGSVAMDGHYVSISVNILKGIGCITSMGSLTTQFKDKNLYREIVPYAKTCKDRINIESFSNLYSESIKKFGMSRDINLENLEI